MSRFYLGLSTSGHDPALAIVDEDGRIRFAEATERFLQDKRAWGAAPDLVGHLESALNVVGFDPASDQLVVSTSWARVKADLPVSVSNAMLPVTDGLWLRGLQAHAQAAAGDSLLRLGLAQTPPEVRHFDHHLTHAVGACSSAPFDHGLCLVIDGEGDVGAASLFRLREGRLSRLWRSWGPGSLGSYYAWLTGLCGFDWRAGEEWKVMGLAAFGTPDDALVGTLESMLDIVDGRPRLPEQAVIDAAVARATPYGRMPRDPVERAAGLAASGQAAYARMADRILESCATLDERNLVLSGGCALNSSYNGTIRGRFGFDHVHVPSAPADDGNALGAALLSWMQDHPDQPGMSGAASPFLGTCPDRRVIEQTVANCGHSRISAVAGEGGLSILASRLAAGQIIGVMRGGAEFGPRALGHRSILADPRPGDMKDRLNQRVKGREPYRPFAPVVPADRVGEWFDRAQPSPYMSFTLPWKTAVRDRVPAVVHADGTGRLQTVDASSDPWMNGLLAAFEAQTGAPIVLNTSFNVMGKPMVHSVQDAMAVLATTGLDGVLLEDVLIEKGA
ncbi:carbamoyltransferase family protein [Brevundimonas sp.]|uniref:carbamoyltransferase family protein n=1 Tax=Brevundimonas sp. TaxID=1871086 RepID=UPI002D68A4F2|nr:carbamoyltransferase C-terminal domain-containing protein [Brevundimonas sp.]HYC99368.1 carbamoyltransferase C-terminal domain-containing protein [Brevundimonas sp.]